MRFLMIFLIGGICGAGVLYYTQNDSRPAHVAAGMTDKVKDTAADARDLVFDKLVDWHLTSDDIKADLAKGGDIVRSKAVIAGERITDARIVTVINAKLVLDRDLSATTINVDCKDGDVTLKGSVSTSPLIGRAMGLALDTGGVKTVTSRLSVGAGK